MFFRSRFWVSLAAAVALFALTATQALAARCGMEGTPNTHACCNEQADPSVSAGDACPEMLPATPELIDVEPSDRPAREAIPVQEPASAPALGPAVIDVNRLALPDISRSEAPPTYGSVESLPVLHSVFRI